MKLLSIDASGKTAACALTENGEIIAKSFTDSGLTHSQTLLPMIKSMLALAGVDISEVDEFALTVGPGSFTGLRIGAATVMGLAGDRPCRCVPTLSAIAYNLKDKNGIIIPALDARRNQVYTAVFKCEGGVITQLEDDCAISVEEVFDKISRYSTEYSVYIAGDGAYLFENAAAVYPSVEFADGNLLYPQGEGIANASVSIAPISARDIKLSYLRLSQAEREMKERNKK